MSPPDALDLTYLQGYPERVIADVRDLAARGELRDWILARYPEGHRHRNERALYAYAVALKNRHLRQAPPLAKVVYDPRLEVLRNALGLHTRNARVHGNRLSARNEIRVAAVFRRAPQAFLDMILVHELAHLKVPDHSRAFYQLCRHMEPEYDRLELDTRVWLAGRGVVGEMY
jgi:predicted metal-dependent hydrolase